MCYNELVWLERPKNQWVTAETSYEMTMWDHFNREFPRRLDKLAKSLEEWVTKCRCYKLGKPKKEKRKELLHKYIDLYRLDLLDFEFATLCELGCYDVTL